MASLERKLIKAELKQRREEGCDTAEIKKRVAAAIDGKAPAAEFARLYDDLMALPVLDSPYEEPSTLEAIRECRFRAEMVMPAVYKPLPPRDEKMPDLSDAALYDRIYGAWLGRAAGCALGKPVEGWPKARIDKYLAKAGALPLDDYVPFDEKIIPGTLKSSTRGNINGMPRDDDLDYPILGLIALERKGLALDSRTLANTWLARMPYGQVYTAEDAAYRNFVMGIWPPESARYRNPFREWIGAQIRADIFGYAMPGQPERAAGLAFQDAAISHDKNGIYGEMFVAAMVAAAFIHDQVKDIIQAGLWEIPAVCRLSEAVQDAYAWCAEKDDWEGAWAKINKKYGHYHGVHTINNAALVVLGLYFGERDFEQGITSTVRCGWDADCTGATVGSILGAKFGAAALPDKWVGVLNDRLESAVLGHADNRISELAKRTLAVAKDLAKAPDQPKPAKQATLKGLAGGRWELETGWGRQVLDFAKGSIQFVNDDWGPYPLTASSLQDGKLKFSFSIDKGGWDFEVDFEGRVDGDRLEGAFYPTDTPVQGKRVAKG